MIIGAFTVFMSMLLLRYMCTDIYMNSRFCHVTIFCIGVSMYIYIYIHNYMYIYIIICNYSCIKIFILIFIYI